MTLDGPKRRTADVWEVVKVKSETMRASAHPAVALAGGAAQASPVIRPTIRWPSRGLLMLRTALRLVAALTPLADALGQQLLVFLRICMLKTLLACDPADQ